MRFDISGKHVTVLGMGLSGVEAAKMLSRKGSFVWISDCRSEKELTKQILKLSKYPRINIQTGGHTSRILKNSTLVVISPGISPDIPIVRQAQKKHIPIISEIEISYRFLKGRLISITGTNGKTTVTTWLAEMLKSSGLKAAVAGNIGTPIASVVNRATAKYITVSEISSFQLERITSFKPWISVILNITPDHLDRYEDMNDYMRAKGRIFANQTEEDFLILNADDPLCVKLARTARCSVVFFSRRRRKLKKGVFIDKGKIVSTFMPLACEIKTSDISIPGNHNIENALAVVAVSLICGIKVRKIRSVLRKFQGVEHRLEFVRDIKGIRFINDSKATNVSSTLKALESFPPGIILIAGGRDKGSPYTSLRGLVKRKVKALVVIGEAGLKIKNDLKNLTEIYEARDLKHAVSLAFKSAKPANIVLLSPACSSFDMFNNYGHRGKVYKRIVRALKG